MAPPVSSEYGTVSSLTPRLRRWLPASLSALLLLGSSGAWAAEEGGGKTMKPIPTPPSVPGSGGPPLPPSAAPEDGAEAPPPRERPPRITPSKPADDEGATTSEEPSRQKPPTLKSGAKVNMDFQDTSLNDLVKYMADITGRNFILTEELKGQVTIISHQPVSVSEAYEAFLSALEMSGYTTVTVGEATKVIPTSSAANTPLRVYEGANIPYTENYVTQIIQLDNVSVSEISPLVKDLSGKGAKIIAYAPTNTMIITDVATNIRRVYKIISQLDVAAPKAKMEIIPIQHATAAEIEKLVQDLYGGGESTKAASSSSSSESKGGRRRRAREESIDTTPSEASASNVGTEGKYIERIISDERTNSLIVVANDTAMQAVKDLIAKIDVDVDPASRAQIHVIYLEHAKAEEVATVLSNLANESRSNSASSRTTSTTARRGANGQAASGRSSERGGAGALADRGAAAGGESGEGGAVAAFESGLKITSDENTNSLVLIATPDQFDILRQVIEKLDIRRKQVFVECVVLELASDDSNEFGLGMHLGNGKNDVITVGSAQLNGSSLGLSTESLSGMAVGVYGPSIEVPIFSSDGSQQTLAVPAFGIALNALQQNSSVNIVSTPNILTMDNEEAKIVIGRNIPFPVSAGRDNNNNPIVSYQREDVATTLKVTPQINESNYVTLNVFQEVQEIEEDSSGLDVNSAGFITSKRQIENTVVVKDNQTIVIGGLIGETTTQVETKVPVLGDLPLIGRLFRGERESSRKTNMLVFLTPHIVDEPADLEEIYRIKWAQRQEFIRRFYGKSLEDQEKEFQNLFSYSMNQVDRPSQYRGSPDGAERFQVIGGEDKPAEAKPAEPEPTDEELLLRRDAGK